ncbi:hypothetical protein [Streptomyces siamensis]|uniref:Uncharacterized protein n=1 Tax=Streptomyces siamensis TaxID=1274986 RepID=A0ABP9ISV9_9ACTN
MSVSRTTVRLIATFVATGALVGAAAMPALAAGAGHDRDNGRGYSHSDRGDRHHDGHFGDRDRGWDRGEHRGWDRDRHHRWDRDRHHGWDRDRDRDRGWHHGWDRDRHHGWDRDRGWHHGHR